MSTRRFAAPISLGSPHTGAYLATITKAPVRGGRSLPQLCDSHDDGANVVLNRNTANIVSALGSKLEFGVGFPPRVQSGHLGHLDYGVCG